MHHEYFHYVFSSLAHFYSTLGISAFFILQLEIDRKGGKREMGQEVRFIYTYMACPLKVELQEQHLCVILLK